MLAGLGVEQGQYQTGEAYKIQQIPRGKYGLGSLRAVRRAAACAALDSPSASLAPCAGAVLLGRYSAAPAGGFYCWPAFDKIGAGRGHFLEEAGRVARCFMGDG
jgi:hypothetical protein